MKRLAIYLSVLGVLLSLSASAGACVGKTLIIGTEPTPESQLAAQVIAILVNERTGTTVKVQDFDTMDSVYRELTRGDVDIAVEFPARALRRLGKDVPPDAEMAYTNAKAVYLEQLNLVWLVPLGYHDPAGDTGVAAPVAQKHTLKKFPALPRLIAKTRNLLPDETVARLVNSGELSDVARDFLREKKLI